MNEPQNTAPPPIVAVLIVAGLITTLIAAAALVTGADTTFKVAGVIALVCVATSACILERYELLRYTERVWARRNREAGIE